MVDEQRANGHRYYVTRFEWDQHLRWGDDTLRKTESRLDSHHERIDDIERRMDRYLGIAITMPWVLSILLGVGWLADRWGLL